MCGAKHALCLLLVLAWHALFEKCLSRQRQSARRAKVRAFAATHSEPETGYARVYTFVNVEQVPPNNERLLCLPKVVAKVALRPPLRTVLLWSSVL